MTEKRLPTTLIMLVLSLICSTVGTAQTKSQALSPSPEMTKSKVQMLGFGQRVNVRLLDGTRVRGRITGLADDTFIVTNAETGASMKVLYSQVEKIDKQRGLPKIFKGALTAIVVTAAVVGTLIVLALLFPD